jgi:hypothetical protein
MTGKTQLRRAVQKKFASKADKQILIPGLLGAYIGAVWMVSVPGRPSFVYVRVHGNNSEVIEAFNDTVSPILNLAVVLTRDELTPNYYRILRRDVAKYQDWYTPQIGYHATQHEFGGTGSMGADIVWVQKQQFVPLEVRPVSTSGSTYQCFVDPEYYQWNAGYQFFSGGATPDLNFLRPGGQLQGLFLGVYMDGNTDALAYITGTQFTHTPWPDNYRALIPTVPTSVGIPLAGILLTHEMVGINWAQIYDVRAILGNGGMTGSAASLPDAPSDGNLYGRENAAWVAVTGTGGGGIPDAPSDGTIYGRKNAAWEAVTGTGGSPETDPLSLHLDQTAPQTFTNLDGGTGLLEVTAGVLGLDTKQYVTGAPWAGMGYITGSPGGDMLKSVYDPNDDGIIDILQGGTGATGTVEARTNLGLGNSAILDVGTISGTVAAGDDPRFSGISGTSGGGNLIRSVLGI